MKTIARTVHAGRARRDHRPGIAGALVLAIALAACAGKPVGPTVVLNAGGFLVQLPPEMQRALDSLAPAFRSVRTIQFRTDVPQAAAEEGGAMQPLFAVTADFDGDGTVDAVEEGTVPGDPALLVIAIMNGPRPWAMEVTRAPVYDADAVGLYLSLPTGIGAGAFTFVNYPDSSTVYRYATRRFVGTRVGG